MEDNKIIPFKKKALKKWTRAVTTSKRGYGLFNEGMCFYNQDKDKQALEKFKLAESEGYVSADMYSSMAYIYYDVLNDREKARYYVDKAIKTDKEYGYPYRIKALIVDDENDNENSLKYNLLAEKYDHTTPQMMRHISELYKRQANFLKALEYATKAIELNPKDSYNWYFKGWIYYRFDDYVNAIKFFGKAESKGCCHPDFYFEYSYAYGELGEHKKAVEYANKYIFVDKESFSGYYRKGHAYLMQDNFDKALEAFLMAEKKNCNCADMYSRIAFIYSNKKEYDKAFEYTDKALSFDKKEADAYYIKAYIYFIGHYDFKSSLKYLKKARKIYDLTGGLNTEAYYYLTANYMLMSKHKKSFEVIEEALSIHPEEPYLLLMKACVLQNLKRYSEADELVNKYFKDIETQDPFVISYLATIAYNSKVKPKNYDKILDYLDMITDEDDEDKKAIQSFCYYDLKEYEKSLQLLYEYAQKIDIKLFLATNRSEIRKYYRRLVKMFGKDESRLRFIHDKFKEVLEQKSSK